MFSNFSYRGIEPLIDGDRTHHSPICSWHPICLFYVRFRLKTGIKLTCFGGYYGSFCKQFSCEDKYFKAGECHASCGGHDDDVRGHYYCVVGTSAPYGGKACRSGRSMKTRLYYIRTFHVCCITVKNEYVTRVKENPLPNDIHGT